MKKQNWVWMPHAGHFICGNRCEFTLNTYVGKYIVSTVGELPKTDVDRRFDRIKEEREERYQKINANGKYETMVFKAKRSEYKCCPWEIIVQKQVDYDYYNSNDDAYIGHLKLCRKWSNK